MPRWKRCWGAGTHVRFDRIGEVQAMRPCWRSQNARALGEAMIRVLEDEPLRAALKIKGFNRSKQFSWEQAATKTVALYGELCRDDR